MGKEPLVSNAIGIVVQRTQDKSKCPQGSPLLCRSRASIGGRHSCLSSDCSQLPNTEQFHYLPGPTRHLGFIPFWSIKHLYNPPPHLWWCSRRAHWTHIHSSSWWRFTTAKGIKCQRERGRAAGVCHMSGRRWQGPSLPHHSHIGHVQFPQQQDVTKRVKVVHRGTS